VDLSTEKIPSLELYLNSSYWVSACLAHFRSIRNILGIVEVDRYGRTRLSRQMTLNWSSTR
jgi:hypothetical protein